MFDKYAFRQFWTESLETICFTTLDVDPAKIGWEPWKKSTIAFFCNGLVLGDKTAHLTITPDTDDEFEYFHFTLDQPEVASVQKAHVRCDHVFFEITNMRGDIEVTTSLRDVDGKKTTADSKSGLTHNAAFLVSKVKNDLEKLMNCFSATHYKEKAGWQAVG